MGSCVITKFRPRAEARSQNVERGHHGDGNSGHRRIRITRLEGVDGVLLPFDADLLLDLFDDGTRRGLGLLGLRSEEATRI